MRNRKICGYSSTVYKGLTDSVGALDKNIKLKRLERFSEIIGEVLNNYRQDLDKRTMMFKLIRHPVEGTTQRERHSLNVKYIAGQIADEFDWLNSNITKIIAYNHDTGHTPMGHSGEWWISSIFEDYALPYYVHNAIGARKLSYNNKVFDEIEERILKEHPDISKRMLRKIKRDLWLIFDGINCHNGERSESSYEPDFSKTQKRSKEEIMNCYTKHGFDMTLVPATSEGCLMRLCDKISYIPFDMVDIFRNGCAIETGEYNGEKHNFYREYEEIFNRIGMKPGSIQRLLNCKSNDDYDEFARGIQKIFITDVIKNSRRNKIRMSSKMAKAMHDMRRLNNLMMVNDVVLEEDHEAYISSINSLVNYYGGLLVDRLLVNTGDDNTLNPFSTVFNASDKNDPIIGGFADFVGNINRDDFNFTVEACRRAFEETIEGEIEIAQNVALGLITEDKIKDIFNQELRLKNNELGLNNKELRVKSFIKAFRNSIELAHREKVFNEDSTNPFNSFKKKFWLKLTRNKIKKMAIEQCNGHNRTNEFNGIIPIERMICMDIGGQYIASLNDEQFFELIQKARLITPDQAESLQRPYNSFDFRKESKKHSAWIGIGKLQNNSEDSSKEPSFFKKIFGRER
ncbi:MAG: HD domain-containing protein [Clostridia bacterium]|nr:HD domain-containing protein [Clostridia bacterium]